MDLLIWILILICISQSAMFSGSNLAFFSITKLRLELEARKDNKDALKVMALRKDINFLLVTILWGNVGVNVLLALLSGSVLAGVSAFFFSTFIITILGEIIPQAYFSRNALKVAAILAPIIKIYQILLYPVAKPTALLLDKWLGKEAISFFQESDFRELLEIHMQSSETDIDRTEGTGAMNFLDLDDLPLRAEGERIDPDSIVKIDFAHGFPVFPEIKASPDDVFLQSLLLSEKKWVVFIDENNEPHFVINADRFLRELFLKPGQVNPIRFCHRPILIRDDSIPIGHVITRFKVNPEHSQDDVIDEDIILLWGEQKKIITGSDLLGRLLRGIVQNQGIKK